MSATLLHVLVAVVVVVVVLAQEDTSNMTTSLCSVAEYEVDKGKVIFDNIGSKNMSSSPQSKKLYVRPKKGFLGIIVTVQGQNQGREDAWFPMNEDCLPANNSWWELYVQVVFKKNTDTDQMLFRMYCGDCKLSCSTDCTIQGIVGFKVEARGPSSWNTTLISSCKALPYNSEPSNAQCRKLPIAVPSPMFTEAALIGATVAVVVVVMMAAVCHRQRRRSAEPHPQATEPASEIQDTRNSIYEPFSAFKNVGPSEDEAPHVTRNSLYEPFENVKNPAFTAEQDGSLYGSQNSLYESVSKYQDPALDANHRMAT